MRKGAAAMLAALGDDPHEAHGRPTSREETIPSYDQKKSSWEPPPRITPRTTGGLRLPKYL